MKIQPFFAVILFSVITVFPVVGQSDPEIAYLPVEWWLKDQKIAMAEEPLKSSIEKAHLNNIRLAYIQNGIPATAYQAFLKEVLLEFYRKNPVPSDTRTASLWGYRNLLLKNISLKGPKPVKGLRDTRLPTVDQWLKENKLEVAGTWDDAFGEMAILHNFRIVSMVNEIPQETYRAMLKDCILPILKVEKAGVRRGDAIMTAKEMLLWSFDPIESKLEKGKKE